MFTTWFLKALWDVVSLFLSNFKYKIVSKNYFSRAMYAGLNEFWTLLKIFLWSFMKSLGKERGGQVITFSCCWATISDFSYYTSPEINYSSFPSREKKTKHTTFWDVPCMYVQLPPQTDCQTQGGSSSGGREGICFFLGDARTLEHL